MTLRIQKSMQRQRVIFSLTGRIQAAQVPELLALLKSESPAHGIVLDLEVLFLALSEGARRRAEELLYLHPKVD